MMLYNNNLISHPSETCFLGADNTRAQPLQKHLGKARRAKQPGVPVKRGCVRQFERLLQIVGPSIAKQETNWREATEASGCVGVYKRAV